MITFPQNLEAEQAVIGSIFVDNTSFYKISHLITQNNFYDERNRSIFRVITQLLGNKEQANILAVSEKLPNMARSYLVECTMKITTATQIISYAKIVLDKSIRRQLIIAQELNTQVIYDENIDIETVLAETQKQILEVNLVKKQEDGSQAIITEIEAVQQEYSEKYKQGKKYLGIESGFEKLDEIIDGLRPGHVWVVGAFTSTGKTQFSLNVVHSVLEQNVPVSIISLEMSRVDTVARLIGIRHNISSMRVLKGINDADTTQRIDEGKLFFRQTPLEVHTTYFELEKIKMLIRHDVYARGVKLVVVDYVQNIMSDKALREYDLLTQSAVDLQALARELNITIYIVSQISNEAEKGQGAGAGFKGTGALEAVADLAIRLKRERKDESTNDDFVPVKIVVSKNRHGFTGNIDNYCMWLKSGKFEKDLMYINADIKQQMYGTHK